MNFKARKRLGIIIMAVSLVFLIAVTSTLFLHTDEGNHREAPPAEMSHSWTTENEELKEKRINPNPYDLTFWPDGMELGGTGLEQPHPGL